MCIDNTGTRYSIEQMEIINEARYLIAADEIVHIIANPSFNHEEMRELLLCALNGVAIPDNAGEDVRQAIMKDDITRVQAKANEIFEAKRLCGKARRIAERERNL